MSQKIKSNQRKFLLLVSFVSLMYIAHLEQKIWNMSPKLEVRISTLQNVITKVLLYKSAVGLVSSTLSNKGFE